MRLIGMVIPDGANQFFSSVAQLFQRALAEARCALVVMDSDGSNARELEALEILFDMGVEGLVFVSAGDSMHAFQRLHEWGKPVLVLDREIAMLDNADFLVLDNESGVRHAVEYLASLGHSRIACIQGALNTAPGRSRAIAFKESCDDLGIELADDLLFDGDFTFAAGRAAAEQILALDEIARPTAVFACNDLMAIGALQKFAEAGLNVPESISIVGFDDIPMASWVHPRLTTIQQDTMETARVGAELLVRRVDHAVFDPPPGSHLRDLKPRLVVRASCSTVEDRSVRH